MTTWFWKADIQSVQGNSFWGRSYCRRSGTVRHRTHLIFISEVTKFHFQFSVTPVYSVQSCFQGLQTWPLTVDLLLLKIWYFNFLKEYQYCVHIAVIWNICKYQVGTTVGLHFMKLFAVNSLFTCADKATYRDMFRLDSKGFWWWCIILGSTGFLGFIH
jgi:hypothetical protein